MSIKSLGSYQKEVLALEDHEMFSMGKSRVAAAGKEEQSRNPRAYIQKACDIMDYFVYRGIGGHIFEILDQHTSTWGAAATSVRLATRLDNKNINAMAYYLDPTGFMPCLNLAEASEDVDCRGLLRRMQIALGFLTELLVELQNPVHKDLPFKGTLMEKLLLRKNHLEEQMAGYDSAHSLGARMK